MKKKLIYVITAVIILILSTYIFATPKGALRFAIFRLGYPVTSINMKLSDTPYKTDIRSNEKIYSLANPPTAKATQSELVNWIVSKHSIFYWAEYYGW